MGKNSFKNKLGLGLSFAIALQAFSLAPVSHAASDGSDKTPITGANGLKYTVTSVDDGYYLLFAVTPKAQTGTPTGATAVSPGRHAFTSYVPDPSPAATDVPFQHQRYILGYPDGQFHPDNSLTRAELTAIVARLTENEQLGGVLGFTDVQDSHWAANYIKIAMKHGYFGGFEDGSFRPEAPVSRGELAVVMARFLKLQAGAPGAFHFTDTEGHWSANAVEALYRGKFLSGYEDGTFKPGDRIRRVEAVTMINRMLYRGPLKEAVQVFPDIPASYWGFGDVQEATVSHESVRNEDGSENWKSEVEDTVE